MLLLIIIHVKLFVSTFVGSCSVHVSAKQENLSLSHALEAMEDYNISVKSRYAPWLSISNWTQTTVNVTLPFITRGFIILDAELSLLRLNVAAMSSSDAFEVSRIIQTTPKSTVVCHFCNL